MTDVYKKAEIFIYRQARPLDLARWQYHFEGGSRDAVLRALRFYQNEDGGFGHALEADAWNPHSTPIQTWTAAQILREVDFVDRKHPLVEGLLTYLERRAEFDGHFWPRTLSSNNDYPRAPWWTHSDGEASTYNPTASLAAFYVRSGDPGSAFYPEAQRVVREAVDAYLEDSAPENHTLSCYVDLLGDLAMSGQSGLVDLHKLLGKLKEDVDKSIEQDSSLWAGNYVVKPSQFIRGRDCPFYPGNEALVLAECAMIGQSQAEDGGWPVTWSWGAYPEEFAISAKYWQSQIAINNILFLRAFEER